MPSKSKQYHKSDSTNLKKFDAKDDGSCITLKTEPKEWVDDSLLGKTIFIKTTEPSKTKFISIADTLTPPSYIVLPKKNSERKQVFVTSIFSKHELRTSKINPKFKTYPHSDWSLSIFLIGFSLLAVANVYYLKRFNLFTKAFFLQRFTSQLMREDNSQTQRLSIILSTVYLFAISLFAIKFNELNSIITFSISPLVQFITLATIVLCFFVFKIMLNYFIGYIFKTEKEVSEYIFNIILLNQFLGIALFFICFMLYYAVSTFIKVLLIIGISVILAIYLYRIIRGLLTTKYNKNISAIYLFLYFCSLEILPLVLITKILLG